MAEYVPPLPDAPPRYEVRIDGVWDNEANALVVGEREPFTDACRCLNAYEHAFRLLYHRHSPHGSELDRRLEVEKRWQEQGHLLASLGYQIGKWTEDVRHADPCDCDLDEETVGERCMENSEWCWALLKDGGAFAPQLAWPMTGPEHVAISRQLLDHLEAVVEYFTCEAVEGSQP